MVPKISVIIPTYNRPKYLSQVIGSYFSQDFVSQLIVIDDGGTESYDDVVSLIRKGCDERGIEFIYKKSAKRQGASSSRNIGLNYAKGDYILITDDDIFLSQGFCKVLINKIREYNAFIAGGRVVWLRSLKDFKQNLIGTRGIEGKGELINWKTFERNFMIDTEEDKELPFITSPSLWRKHIFDSGIRFFEGYKGNEYREETDPQIEVLKTGGRIIYAPKAISWHLPRRGRGGQSRGSLFWREFWTIYCNGIFLKRHGNFLKSEFGIHPFASCLLFALNRINPLRLLKCFRW